MKFKNLKFSLYIITVFAVVISCKKDDDSSVKFEERDRTEQQIADKDSLLAYLSTHYYNSSFFESGSNRKFTDIVIKELEQDEAGNYLEMPNPDQNTLLIEAIETHYTTYLDVAYEYYIIRLNQGEGEAPKFTDAVRVRYEGSSVVSNQVFDAISTPSAIQLVGNGFSTLGTIRGWQLVLPKFNTAMDFDIDGNGNVNYQNYGLGVMFLPSGLAYFSGTSTGSSYDNLMFKFELLQYEQLDHEQDGIPSYVEDLDSDSNVNNDDTDGDGLPNYVDADDDGDGVATFNELMPGTRSFNEGEQEPVLNENEYEISRATSGGITTIKTVTALDSNNSGMLDYLDETVSINYNELVN